MELSFRGPKIPDLHLHSYDLYDAQNNPEDVCRRLAELHSEGFALTQHGVLSGIEPMRQAAKKYGLKFIPGVETYYQSDTLPGRKQHLILLAMDDIGYKAISMAVTRSNKEDGKSLMNDETLQTYFGEGAPGHGHVISTSACVAGPVAAVFTGNRGESKKLYQILQKMKTREDAPRIIKETKEQIALLTKEKSEARKQRDDAKKAKEKIQKGTYDRKKQALTERYENGRLEKDSYVFRMSTITKEENQAKESAAGYKRSCRLFDEKSKALKEANRTLAKYEKAVSEYKDLKAEAEALKKNMRTKEQMMAEARKVVRKMVSIFGKGNFYLELQYHRISYEKTAYRNIAALAKEMKIPTVATNDVHLVYGTEDEFLRRCLLRSMRYNQAFESDQDGDRELYIKTDEELSSTLLEILHEDDVRNAMQGAWDIFDRCQVNFETSSHYPRFTKDGMSSDELLDAEIKKGIKWRFPNGLPDGYAERIAYESGIIKQMGYSDYHLIVQDFIRYGRALSAVPDERISEAPLTTDALLSWTKKNHWDGGIAIGPGRGSAAGSLVCYLLGITSLDPIPQGLLFERFLNPERASMPDIDTDMAKNIRQQMIRYVQHTYGNDAVCGIMTMSFMAPKGAVRNAARFYGLKTRQDNTAFAAIADRISKDMPKDPKLAFSSKMEDGRSVMEHLVSLYGHDEDALNILHWAGIMEGSFYAYGMHAAGIVISDNSDVSEYLPLRYNYDKAAKKGFWTTQCDMVVTEEKGLLKMDFLGLKTLDIIKNACFLIKEHTGKTIYPEDIPLDDPAVFEKIFQTGRTRSVFQVESSGMRSMLKKFAPDRFEDIIILLSMYRPGPMQFLEDVIDVKHGRKQASYLTPQLSSILGKTYGAIVYQEQVMEIFRLLAGYSLGQADEVRRYMSKKKADKLEHERHAFIYGDPDRGIDGCVHRDVTPEAANAIFDQMNAFSSYAFNKSHAAVYSMITMYTAWLKLYYPAEFFAACMNFQEDKSAEDRAIPALVYDAASFGVSVLPPSINRSGRTFRVCGDNQILFGLFRVRGVKNGADALLSERDNEGRYRSLADVVFRSGAGKGVLVPLIRSGAMDDFSTSRTEMEKALEEILPHAENYFKATKQAQSLELLLPFIDRIHAMDELNAKLEDLSLKKTVLRKLLTKEELRQRIEEQYAFAEEERKNGYYVPVPSGKGVYDKHKVRSENEYEYLGVYLSSHPLTPYIISYKSGGMTTVENLMASDQVNKIRLAGVLTQVQVKRTKRGSVMASAVLDDRTGTIGLIFFDSTYSRYQKLIQNGSVVTVEGRLNLRDGEDREDASVSCSGITPLSSSIGIAGSVPSEEWFYTNLYDRLKRQYSVDVGYPFLIYAPDATGKLVFMETDLIVSDRAASLPGVKKL